ncbi:hypothetical protein FS749_015279 [Ceratobasidium sp. UAMH 11750]|nr:hypothetical protein FS749_015279 [Ceratobasidium sp. UAMH 11750]
MYNIGSPHRSGRARRTTKKFEEYCGTGEGEENFRLFSQSVGMPAPPPDPAERTAEQAQKQKAAAKARGNATQPAPLSPEPKRRKGGDGGVLIDRDFKALRTVEDRIEWLYQAIEQFDDQTDYRGDPDLQDEEQLWEIYQDLLDGGGANDDTRSPSPQPERDSNIRSGALKELQSHESGRRIGPKLVSVDHATLRSPNRNPGPARDSGPARAPSKLVRTDHTTIGLDGRAPHAPHHREFGQRDLDQPARVSAPGLVWTDHTTIGLDGLRISPPTSLAARHSTTAKPSAEVRGRNPTTDQATPASTTTRPADKPAASKKRPLISRARVDAIRAENKAHGQVSKGRVADTDTGGSANRVPAPSASTWGPRQAAAALDGDGDIQMADPTLSDDELPDQAGEEQEEAEADGAPPAPATSGQGENDDVEDNNSGRRRRRRGEDVLIAKLGLAAPLVKYVIANIKIEMAATCGFPEHVMSTDDPNTPLLDVWMARFWAAANDKYRSVLHKIDRKKLPWQMGPLPTIILMLT